MKKKRIFVSDPLSSKFVEFKYLLKSSDHQYVRANEYIVLTTQFNLLTEENLDSSWEYRWRWVKDD